MIVSYGEILIDRFVNANTNTTTDYVGGAPFNMVYQASLMGSHVLFVGNIGKDEEGKKIETFFEQHSLDQRGLRVDPKRKTTVAKVTLDKGERSFTFERDNTADSFFDDESLDFISVGDIIHVGSLMLSSKEGRDFAKQIITFARSQNKLLTFDINYREDIFRDKEEALSIYNEFYPQFDIVKFSEDELKLFTGKDDVEEGIKSLHVGPKLILVTLGRKGSVAYCNHRIVKAPSVSVHTVDTTGAGDSFFGTFLSNVDSLGLQEMLFLPSLMESNLHFSNLAGALSTTKRGAIASMPTYKEVNRLLEKKTSL